MKQKYLLLTMILFVFLFSTTTLSVFAVTPNLELTPPTQSVTVGNQANMNVEVEEVTNLKGANITLNFDASKLQYISSADGGFIPSAILLEQSIDNTNGTVILDIAGLGASAYASGTGTIMRAVFERIATGNINVTFGTTELRDKDNITITHTKGSGCLITSLISDFYPDGCVDFEDLMIFAMAYSSCSGDANWNPVCDIAGSGGSLTPDGCIDFEDLMIFAMHYGDGCNGCTPPSSPNLSDPGSSLPSPATYTVSWSSVSGATSYKIQESTSSSFSGAQEYTTSSNSRSFSHTVSTTTTYYYRVAAVNSCGQSSWSNVEGIIIMAGSGGAAWTVMVYMSGDQSGSSSLDLAAWLDLEEMESIGSTDQVKVVVQLDPYDSCTGTYRYFVTGVDKGLSYPLYPEDIVGSLSEQDMSDPAVLANFVNWATTNYPADHYLLVLWDHGGGWREEGIINRGIMWDYTPSYSYMSMEDLADGLDSFNEHIDIIGFDACLMQMIEVAYQIESWVTDAPDYMIGSEESEWFYGWNYDDILNHLTLSPTMSAATLGETIVDDFCYNSGVTTATLSVINLNNFHSIADPIFSAFQLALRNSAYQSEIATARITAQSYNAPDFKDIYDFAERIYMLGVYDCQVEADAVMNFVDNGVAYEGWVGLDVANSHGLSIYLPDTAAEYDSAYSTLLFPLATGWGLFLQHTPSTIVPPTVTTLPADNITQTSARLHGSIDSTGGEDPFDAGVYWGLKVKLFYSESETESIGSNMTRIINITDNNKIDINQTEGPTSTYFYFGEEEKISSFTEKYGVGIYYVDLTGLNCNTTYQYRAYAENSAGEGTGDYEDFTTLPCTIVPPTVSMGDFYDYSATEVQAYGKIESTGGENPYKAGMCIMDLTTGSDPICWYILGDFQAGYIYYIIIPDLVSGHEYAYCAYAENSAGKGYSDWWGFTKP